MASRKEKGERRMSEGRILRDENMGNSGFKNQDMI
jgi:hypothetical protein